MKSVKQSARLLALGLLLALHSMAQTSVSDWLAKGKQLRESKKYTEAIEAYQQARKLDKSNFEAFYQLGWLYNETKQYPLAIEYLQRAAQLNGYTANIYFELGYAADQTDEPAQAEEWYLKCLDMNAKHSNALKEMGDLRLNEERYQDAVAYYKKAVEADPKHEKAFNRMGYAFNSLEQYDNALWALRKANSLLATTNTYNEMGYAYYKRKQADSSLYAYQQSLLLATTGNGTAYKGMGDVYRLLYSPAKTTEAMDAYKKANELYANTNVGTLYGLGWCYNSLGRFSEAVPYLEASININPKGLASLSEMIYAKYRLGQYSDANSYLQKALQVDGRHRLSLYYGGLSYVAQRDGSNARRLLETLRSVDSGLADKLSKSISDAGL